MKNNLILFTHREAYQFVWKDKNLISFYEEESKLVFMKNLSTVLMYYTCEVESNFVIIDKESNFGFMSHNIRLLSRIKRHIVFISTKKLESVKTIKICFEANWSILVASQRWRCPCSSPKSPSCRRRQPRRSGWARTRCWCQTWAWGNSCCPRGSCGAWQASSGQCPVQRKKNHTTFTVFWFSNLVII